TIYPLSDRSRLVLRVWPAGRVLTNDGASSRPLWVGAVVEERMQRLLSLVTVSAAQPDVDGPREVLARSLSDGRLVRRDDEKPSKSWDGQVLLDHDGAVPQH